MSARAVKNAWVSSRRGDNFSDTKFHTSVAQTIRAFLIENIIMSVSSIHTSLCGKICNGICIVCLVVNILAMLESITVFQVVLSLTFSCTVILCILPVHMWKETTELEQYRRIQRHGILTPATITFSDTSHQVDDDDMFCTGAEIRYRIPISNNNNCIVEIVKTTITTRSYEPDEGAVESPVEVIVLPDYPKSGMEPSHVNNEVGLIEKKLVKHCRYLVLCFFLAIFTWPWTIHAATEKEQL